VVSPRVSQKLERLVTILSERTAWSKPLAHVKRMRQWVLEAEEILDGSRVQGKAGISTATVGQRLDAWRTTKAAQLRTSALALVEQECLKEFLQQLSNLRPYLVQCYDRKGFPRTNNDMERSIRSLKTRYRRISGRKNWNNYSARLWALRGVLRVVGARCNQTATTRQTGGSTRSRSLARASSRSKHRATEATHAFSLPSQAHSFSRDA
jgi:hypothetical protein